MAISGLLVSGPACAGPLTASDILSQFNAVVFGTFTSTADVEGRTVVGGNMTGGATFNIAPGSAAASSYAALTVYGNQTGTGTYNVNNGGGVTIAGSNVGSFNLNGGGAAWVGGSNSGRITSSGKGASITVAGANSGQLSLSAGGSVFVGGANSGQISIGGGTGTVAVLGTTTNNITLNNGGSVYAGGTASNGNISVSGGSAAISVNASNTAQVTANNGGTVRIAGNTGNVNMNGGALYYTGSVTGALNLNGGATRTQVSDAGITVPSTPVSTLSSFSTTFLKPMLELSGQLAGLSSNSSVTTSGNSVTFNANPDSSGQAVFNIDGSTFAPNSTVTIQLNGATSVIVNVTVSSCVSSVCALSLPNSLNFVSPTGYAENVLWNFVNATSLAFPNEFGGTVLAPYATVSNQAPIDGTLVAANYNGNGELHSYSFKGSLTPASDFPAPVPEPASLMVLGAGLAGLGLLRRRRSL